MNQKKELKTNPYITKAYFKLWNVFLDLIQRERFLKDVKKIRKDKGIPELGIKKRKDVHIHYHKEVDKLCEKYGFDPSYYSDTFSSFIFYNEVSPPDPNIGLCEIVDIFDAVYTKTYDNLYPISIRISPYASLRDIQEFLNKNFFLIRHLKDKYNDPKVKIGKLKGKNEMIQERNSLIWENRKLSIKEIIKKVFEMSGEILDYNYINKIIVLENKKRKEV